ncbi:ankyrin repeat-containing domain protein [Morchella snyderi]|nr:ankyrin repeat-containing domain protein [Morchella snyderi]
MSLLALPIELLLQILTYLPGASVCALVRTSRRFCPLLTPSLKRFIPPDRTFTHAGATFSCTLHWSALRGHIGLFKLLITDYSPHCRCHEATTPLLHLAAFGGNVGIIMHLLDHAGFADKLNKREDGAEGCTPLHFAVLGGHEDAAHFLIARGADVNGLDGRSFPPLLASSSRITNTHWNPRVFKLLIESGANINSRYGELGTTALHEAVIRRNLDMLTILLDHGASATIRRYSGDTALELALYREDAEVVKFLQKRNLVGKLEGKFYDERPPIQVGFRGGVEYWRLACGKGWRNKVRAVAKALMESNPHAGRWELREHDAKAKARIARKSKANKA